MLQAGKQQERFQDIRPILRRNVENAWYRTEQVRDELYDSLQKFCEHHSLDALVLKAPPGVYPPWIKFECWIPNGDNNLTQRAAMSVYIEPKSHHRFPYEFQVYTWYGNEKKSLKHIIRLNTKDIDDFMNYILGWGRKPKPRRARVAAWQLWRPKNKVIALGRDWLGTLESFLYLGVVAALGYPFLMEFRIPPVLTILSFLVAAGMWFGARAISKRAHYIRSEGKPLQEPRNLTRVDSWQTVIFGMGDECSKIQTQFLEKLSSGGLPHLKHHLEQVWYWGLDGKEEREQIVITSGRSIVFYQIYKYGQDLYVGWDGHLNTGQWVENTVSRGMDKVQRVMTSLNVITPGVQNPSEYDVIDLSCLMEWTHAQIVKILKDLIAERKIDQEIDFKILRGERQNLSSPRKPQRQSAGFGSFLKRTG